MPPLEKAVPIFIKFWNCPNRAKLFKDKNVEANLFNISRAINFTPEAKPESRVVAQNDFISYSSSMGLANLYIYL